MRFHVHEFVIENFVSVIPSLIPLGEVVIGHELSIIAVAKLTSSIGYDIYQIINKVGLVLSEYLLGDNIVIPIVDNEVVVGDIITTVFELMEDAINGDCQEYWAMTRNHYNFSQLITIL